MLVRVLNQHMSRLLYFSVLFHGLISTSLAVDPPVGCRFLNPIRDPIAENALLEYYHNSEPFKFNEIVLFQPQCLLCENSRKELCVGYKGGAVYGVKSGNINTVQLVTNLPYIYSLTRKIGASSTVVSTIFTLRENMKISYNTLMRFKVTVKSKMILV